MPCLLLRGHLAVGDRGLVAGALLQQVHQLLLLARHRRGALCLLTLQRLYLLGMFKLLCIKSALRLGS